ncbi:MAG: hypothetical protein PHP44_01865 [Kiritimatiellae bacterium]|nr:hypothetical protein [Kiritimatiellia bacterium]
MLVISDTSCTVRHAPLPWILKNKRICLEDIKCIVMHDMNRNAHSTNAQHLYRIVFRLKSGNCVRILPYLSNRQQALEIKAQLESHVPTPPPIRIDDTLRTTSHISNYTVRTNRNGCVTASAAQKFTLAAIIHALPIPVAAAFCHFYHVDLKWYVISIVPFAAATIGFLIVPHFLLKGNFLHLTTDTQRQLLRFGNQAHTYELPFAHIKRIWVEAEDTADLVGIPFRLMVQPGDKAPILVFTGRRKALLHIQNKLERAVGTREARP